MLLYFYSCGMHGSHQVIPSCSSEEPQARPVRHYKVTLYLRTVSVSYTRFTHVAHRLLGQIDNYLRCSDG